MGYALNELANLPVDDNIHFYIFVVNGRFREPLYEMVEENFFNIAQSIGSKAVIAVGTDPRAFTSQVSARYFGDADRCITSLLPALLITNAHPNKLTGDSVRLVIPLREAEERFGGWAHFFTLLSEYVKGDSDEFVKRFEKQEDLLATGNRIVNIRPGMFGLSINVNELIDRWNRRRRGAKA